ncbi:hypothetical protein [Methylomonas koyamae]|uniref:Uncharacterized protein n=1 Tax=Methylomonas koyamae TaxID=702114 RepID=A0A177NLX4_9GAMM|nr:hypothetical protein [Methylomonas koyamae]ATG91900.1 hypothetical protein MKLM6_3715 [Methylomonas koyamae]OAI18925.1 hypothetical protein A1507_08460 [Methylomonas koyamae]
MNIVKKTLASFLVIAAALVSTSANANSAGDAKVRAAAEGTVAKVEEAVSLLDKGADKAEVLKALGEVRQLQKEFRYEQTERLRQKAGDKLKVARDEIEKGDANGAASLKATLELYKEMLKVYLAAH